jgi:GGDEF domain-containing protein
MTEDQGSTNGAHGGVGHLLRMAKTQCGVSLAFAALRKADGGFAIATFPSLTADPSWSVEAIDELVRQTWEDPHLSGGTVLVRSGRVLKGMWTGQGHHIKLAAAALNDPEAPDHPWGLLCVAEPLAGHFEQDQLNLLGNLASRLTSYLRARQQVLEGSLTFQRAPVPEPPAPAPVEVAPEPIEPAYEPMVETPPVADVADVFSEAPAAPPLVGYLEPPAAGTFGDLLDDLDLDEFDDEHPLGQAADASEPDLGGWGSVAPSEAARADEWEFLGVQEQEIEWVEAAVPTLDPDLAETFAEPVAPAPSIEAPPALIEPEPAPASTFGTREDEPVVVSPTPATGTDLDALLGPDPATGLATLTTLVGRLSSSLSHVRNNEGMVGLILVEVSSVAEPGPLSTTALLTVAGRLTNHLRDRDMVARVGPTLFAILVDLRPGAVDLEAIRHRSVGTLADGADSSIGGLTVRSSVVSASAGSTISAEDLLRQAADQLRGQ